MDEKIIDRLRKISIFQRFKEDRSALDIISGVVKLCNFKSGDFIIKEGDQGDVMFILNDGRVSIEKKTLHNDSYTVVKLTGEMNVFFGELALMDDDVRSASVIAESDCECLCIKKEEFDLMGDKHPEIGLYITREIAKILAGRLRNSSRDSIILLGALVSEIEGVV